MDSKFCFREKYTLVNCEQGHLDSEWEAKTPRIVYFLNRPFLEDQTPSGSVNASVKSVPSQFPRSHSTEQQREEDALLLCPYWMIRKAPV